MFFPADDASLEAMHSQPGNQIHLWQILQLRGKINNFSKHQQTVVQYNCTKIEENKLESLF